MGILTKGDKVKGLVVIFSIFLLNTNLIAEEKTFIDNESIQVYKGRLGKWILIDTKKSMVLHAKKISIPLRKIYRINKINNGKIARNYYFFPYSDTHLKRVKERGIKRRIIVTSEDEFIWPVGNVIRITSVLGLRNGKFHPGLDIPAPRGKPIVASMEGFVIYSDYAMGYGKTIVLEHRSNFITRYSHNSVNLVKKGDFVEKGQIIGLIGSTGHSTGNHLHFEIRCKRIPLDPLDFLPKNSNLHIVHTLKNWK